MSLVMTQRWNLEQKKCAVLTMKKGKMATSNPTKLPNKTTIKGLKEGGGYKYLGVIQTDGTTYHLLKAKLKTE